MCRLVGVVLRLDSATYPAEIELLVRPIIDGSFETQQHQVFGSGLLGTNKILTGVFAHDRRMLNEFNQLIGESVPQWTPPPFPPHETMEGSSIVLEPLDADRHASELFLANSLDREGRNWTYLAYGPFESLDQYRAWVENVSAKSDPQFYAIIDCRSQKPVGVASYLRIAPKSGSIEVGHIHFSPALIRTVAATESMYLMMRKAFELGYRRYEWKCDSLNLSSRKAAQRLGFSYEGVFRQATIYKGRNRDTAWFAAIDGEWPDLKRAFESWLDPSNFDDEGVQRQRLSDLTRPIICRFDPAIEASREK